MTRDAIVAVARSWIGTPYRHQASLRGVGCDCLGLVRGVWREVVGPEPEPPPPYPRSWAETDRDEVLLGAASRHLVSTRGPFRPGDMLAFRWRDGRPVKHLAIAVGDAAMVHAHEGAAVTEVALAPWWLRHLAATFSFPGADT